MTILLEYEYGTLMRKLGLVIRLCLKCLKSKTAAKARVATQFSEDKFITAVFAQTKSSRWH
jgi:hypothetical protein